MATRDDEDDERPAPRPRDWLDPERPRLGRFPPGLVVLLPLALFLLVTVAKSVVQVEKGNVGVVLQWGAVQPHPLEPGLHFIVPWVQSVQEMNTQLKSFEVPAEAASKDLQTVTTKISVQHSLNGALAADALQAVGDLSRFDVTVVKPAVEETLKATTAKYTAEELITKREQVKQQVTEAIKAYIDHTLAEKNIRGALQVANVALTEFDFSREFNAAIEAKVRAEQEALQAENEKRKRITQSEAAAAERRNAADAAAYEIEKQSVARAQAIEREARALAGNPGLIQLRATEKWNGALPTFTGGQQPLPFLQLPTPEAR